MSFTPTPLTNMVCVCLQVKVDARDASQSSDGAGASPLTSLEEQHKMEVDLKEELATRDHQLAELREKVDIQEIQMQLLEQTKDQLESQLCEVQQDLNQKLKEKEADFHELQKLSTAQISTLNEKQEVSADGVVECTSSLLHR